MGVEPFLVGTSINLIVAQRLIRRLCSHCKIPAKEKYPKEYYTQLESDIKKAIERVLENLQKRLNQTKEEEKRKQLLSAIAQYQNMLDGELNI